LVPPDVYYVIDPANPYVMGPQLLCAAAELPIDEAEVASWSAHDVAAALIDDGLLRRRGGRYYPTPGVDPHPAVDIRGSTGGQIAIVETGTGRLLGGAGAGQAPATLHPGAVYLHQGDTYLVDSLDFEEAIAFVHAEDPGYSTHARELTDIAVTGPGERTEHGPVTLGLVPVTVTSTVTGYLRRALSGEVLDFVELTMPSQHLPTVAAVYTVTPEALADIGIDPLRIPGHCTQPNTPPSGCCPGCELRSRRHRGLSTAIGPDGLPTVFVYDGYPGGRLRRARIRQAATWLGATAAISARVSAGCPCVQSPKCEQQRSPGQSKGDHRAACGSGRCRTTDPRRRGQISTPAVQRENTAIGTAAQARTGVDAHQCRLPAAHSLSK
jgi:DEAD/DEAH box helicase domain-containing protein